MMVRFNSSYCGYKILFANETVSVMLVSQNIVFCGFISTFGLFEKPFQFYLSLIVFIIPVVSDKTIKFWSKTNEFCNNLTIYFVFKFTQTFIIFIAIQEMVFWVTGGIKIV